RRYVSRAQLFPSLDFFCPLFRGALTDHDTAFDAHASRIAAGFARIGANLFNHRAALVIGPQQRKPAVAKSSHASKRLIVTAAKPDRYQIGRASCRERV